MIDVSEEQSLKAQLPIVVTESGSVIDVSAEQPQKAELPIVATESGSVMDVSEEQPEKAWFPIVLSELGGSVMDVSEEQSLKARFPITCVYCVIKSTSWRLKPSSILPVRRWPAKTAATTALSLIGGKMTVVRAISP